jgi:hypothetical protein
LQRYGKTDKAFYKILMDKKKSVNQRKYRKTLEKQPWFNKDKPFFSTIYNDKDLVIPPAAAKEGITASVGSDKKSSEVKPNSQETPRVEAKFVAAAFEAFTEIKKRRAAAASQKKT